MSYHLRFRSLHFVIDMCGAFSTRVFSSSYSTEPRAVAIACCFGDRWGLRDQELIGRDDTPGVGIFQEQPMTSDAALPAIQHTSTQTPSTVFIFYPLTYSLFVYAFMHIGCFMCGGQKTTCESLPSFHPIVTGYRVQLAKLKGKYLYPLSHLTRQNFI